MIKLIFFFSLFLPLISFSQMSSVTLSAKPVPFPFTRSASVEKWNQDQPGFNKLTADSKDYLYWVNVCRSDPRTFWDSVVSPILKVFPNLNVAEARSLKKDLIETGPLAMFSLNASLITAAQLHAFDIASKNAVPSHTSTTGIDFATRMKNIGIKYCANENISVNGKGSLLAVVLLYLDIGQPGLGHRKSLLNKELVETGVGTYPYGKNQVFIVQDLSCAQK